MKLRSLFLASLAAIAMASCSNEENVVIDEGQTTTKDASLQFGISFTGAETRAVTAGNNEAGIAAEQAFTDATIIIEQAGNKNIMTVPFANFVAGTATGTEPHAPVILWLKDKIAVSDGAASVWVFLNASVALKASLAETSSYTTLKETADFTTNGIGALEIEEGIAESGHFLMSNASGVAESATFKEGEVNTLKVCVSRVASKLEQTTTSTNSYDVASDAANLANASLKVKLTDFAYAGLQQEVAVLKGGTVTANLYKPYGPAATAFDFQAIGASSIANYCMENLLGTSMATTTNIVYKGVISVEDVVSTLYITSDNKAFKSVAEMTAAGYAFEGLTETTTIQDCWDKYALKKYDRGVCYYVGQIKTATANNGSSATIVRNNIYRLTVSSIAGLGTVLPQDFDDPTLLNLTVEIDPWTVNLNSFDF